MVSSNLLGGVGAIAAGLTTLLILVCAFQRPESFAGSGESVLIADIALLLACTLLALWANREHRAAPSKAFKIGAAAGLALGLVLTFRHAAESFVGLSGTTAFVLGAGLIFVMLGLFAVAGSIARGVTGFIALGILASLWACALALVILLAFAFASDWAFENVLAARLGAPFRLSGMSDPRAYLVRNSLDSALEMLTRMPVFAAIAGAGGALANLLVARRSRSIQRALAWITPCVLFGGCWALYYADRLDRPARPPFVTMGVLALAAGLCLAHPIWSALRNQRTNENLEPPSVRWR